MRTRAVPYTPLIHPPSCWDSTPPGDVQAPQGCWVLVSPCAVSPLARMQAAPGCWGGSRQSQRGQEGIFSVSDQVLTAALFWILLLFILALKLTLFPPLPQGLLVTAWLAFNVADGCHNFQPYWILSKHPRSFGYSVHTRCTCISLLAADVVHVFYAERRLCEFPPWFGAGSWVTRYFTHKLRGKVLRKKMFLVGAVMMNTGESWLASKCSW